MMTTEPGNWQVKLGPGVAKQLRKLDKPVARRIYRELDRIAALDNPRDGLKSLQGPLSAYWRARAGDWRVIVDVRDGEMLVLALRVAHRSDIYD